MLPGCSQIPVTIDTILTNEQTYLVERIPLHVLLEIEFIAGFIKGGIYK